MNYLSNQRTELRKAQVAEALVRMKRLNLHYGAIREFYARGEINVSECIGFLFWLTEEEKKLVKEWEKETGNIVYHVIKNKFEYGLCYSFLYVSKNPEEWVSDMKELENGIPFVYVMNTTINEFSEYGCIGIQEFLGGLIRTA